MPTKSELLKARTRSIKSTLRDATQEQKKGHAGISLAENFNKILRDIAEMHPDLASSLPSEITWKGPFAQMRMSDVSYLDLEVMVDQVLALLDLMED